MGCDGIGQLLQTSGTNFNPRTHVGCDSYPCHSYWSGICYFNPRTHVGCDFKRHFNFIFQLISIHAPTWGATAIIGRKNRSDHISIHAPTWGATRGQHRGGDNDKISIHAPTWGATITNKFVCFQQRFQSTHPRGVRQNAIKMIGRFVYFNPRTHVGCDTRSPRSCVPRIHFNPRTHVGCDLQV